MLKTKIQNAVKRFKKSKFLLGAVCLVIGATGMFIWLEGQDYNDWLQEGLSYTHREIVIKDVGASVKAEVRASQDGSGETQSPPPIKEMSVEDEIRTIAKRENFKDADLLVRIASCESGLIPRRDSDVKTSSAKGLFQILNMHGLTAEERYDTDTSTTWAINKIKAGGLNAWNASKHCWNI